MKFHPLVRQPALSRKLALALLVYPLGSAMAQTSLPVPNATTAYGMQEGTTPMRNPVMQYVDEGAYVALHNGEFVFDATDINLLGSGIDLVWTRLYRSQVDYSGPLGPGWTHSFDHRIESDGAGGLRHHDASRLTVDSYPVAGSATLMDCATPGVYRKARLVSGSVYEIREAKGTILRFHALDGSGVAGRLESITDSFGNQIVARYNDAGQLSSLETDRFHPVSAPDRRLDMVYTDGLLTEVIDVANGRTWTYGYTDTGQLQTVATPMVDTWTGSSLTSQSRTAVYGYEKSPSGSEQENNLTSIQYPGQSVARLALVYDSQDWVDEARVLSDPSSAVPAAYKFKYSAAPGPGVSQTVAYDRKDNQNTYTFRAEGQAITLLDAAGQTSAHVYNADGERTQHDRPEGDRLNYTFRSTTVGDRFQHGNLAQIVHVPAAGSPGSTNDYRVQRQHEPVYNQELPTVDEAGAVILDYMEDPSSVATLVAEWGIAFAPGLPLGDVNGDGRTDLHGGSMIERRSASISTGLPTGSSGPVQRVETWTYDDQGHAISYADGEGALSVYVYADGYLIASIEDLDPDPSNCPNTPGVFPNSGADRWSKDCSTEHVEALNIYERDIRGNIVRTLDPRGVYSTYSFNVLDEMTASNFASDYELPFLDPDLASLVEAGYEHLVRPSIGEELSYDAAGRLVRIERDNSGAGDTANPELVVRIAHDLEGRVLEMRERLTSSADAVTGFTYDDNGNQIREVSPEGNVVANVYDSLDRLIETRKGAADDGSITAETSVMTYEYDGNDNRIASTGPEDLDGDGLLEKTIYEYDGRGRLYRTISPTGTETVQAFGSRGWGGRVETRGRVGGPSPMANDTSGNVLLSVSEPERNAVGESVLGRRLLFVPGSTTSNDGPEHEYKRDRVGNVVETIDEAGAVVTSTFDGLGRVLAASDTLGNQTQYVYDAAGHAIRVTAVEADPAGGPSISRTTYNTFDGAGRLIRSVFGGQVSYRAYDAQGQVVAFADGRSSGAAADPLGIYTDGSLPLPGNTRRHVRIRTATGVQAQVHSDLWIGGESNGSVDLWSAGFDPSVVPAGVVSTDTSAIQYDRVGNVAWVQTAGGKLVNFTYDAQNRLLTKSFPDGSTAQTTYWKNGLVRTHSIIDAEGLLYRTIETSYDGDGSRRRVEVTHQPAGYSGTTLQTFEYNGRGLRTRTTDDKLDPTLVDSVVEQAYDSLDRVLSDTQNGLPVTYEHDELNPLGFSFPGGREVDYLYDLRGRLDAIAEGATGATLADYSYFGSAAQLAKVDYGNGTSTNYELPVLGSGLANGYSAAAQPVRFEQRGPGGVVQGLFSIAYDNQGNRTQRLRQVAGTLTGEIIGRDSRSRLNWFQQVIDVTTSLTKGYQRDGDGEWTLIAMQAGGAAPSVYALLAGADDWAYDSIAGISLDHDPAGNLERDAWFEYEYDAFDRLIRITDRYEDIEIGRYSYDGLSRRITKVDWLWGTKNYVYEGPRIAEIRNAAGLVTDQFVHGAPVDELVQWTDSDGDEFYYQLDEMGSVIAVTDDSGAVLERVVYDAFGAPTFTDANGNILRDGDGVPLSESPLGNPFLFQGRDYDAETANWRRAQDSPGYFAEVAGGGLYNFRYRYVSPEEGRFLSRDPYALATNQPVDPSVLVGRILSGEDASPYEFAAGDPVDNADPFGLSTIFIKPDPNTSQGINADWFDVPDHEAAEFLGPSFLETLEFAGALDFALGNTNIFPILGDTKVDHKPCPDGPSGSGGPGSSRGPKDPTPTPKGPRTGGPDGPSGSKPSGGSGGSGGGGGGSGGIRGRLGRLGRFLGKAAGVAGPVLSVLEVKDSAPEDLPVNYFLLCVNPFTAFMDALLGELEDRSGVSGLPQPGSPPGFENISMKLYRTYRQVRKQLEASKKNPKFGWRGDPELKDAERKIREGGVRMSCIYFSRNTFVDGNPGPRANLDCRPMWKDMLKQNEGYLPGEGREQVHSPGEGQEQARFTDPGASPERVAALERYASRRASQREEDDQDPMAAYFGLVGLISVLVSGSSIRLERLLQ